MDKHSEDWKTEDLGKMWKNESWGLKVALGVGKQVGVARSKKHLKSKNLKTVEFDFTEVFYQIQ